ncbi:4-alpha-glucanotransferase [Kutzneria kofuensis]|uniref:4-alpha-glucanotransferase n=1 Tax=Kutzneria kofuensis TaxID=103725 RepID=UPI003CD06488
MLYRPHRGPWRLWWIPAGDARKGTYVRYDAEAMTGILALEAHRANAVVIGEDLGTVEPVVTENVARQQHAVLGGAVVRAGRRTAPCCRSRSGGAGGGQHQHPRPADGAGFLRSEHVPSGAELNVLAGDVDAEYAQAAKERREAPGRPRPRRVGRRGGRDHRVHALLAGTPCRLVLASPYDVIGETRQPNLPGTVDEYPNWRIPFPTNLAAFMADPGSGGRSTRSGDVDRRGSVTA